MGKVGRVVSGLVAMASFASVGVGCAASAGAPVAPLASLAASTSDAPTHLTQTTLAVGIGDAAEAHGDETKADEPAPLPISPATSRHGTRRAAARTARSSRSTRRSSSSASTVRVAAASS